MHKAGRAQISPEDEARRITGACGEASKRLGKSSKSLEGV